MLLACVLLCPFIAFFLWFMYKKRKRDAINATRLRLFSMPFSEAYRQYLVEDFALYQRLPAELQRKLEGHINIFLHEKSIVGRNGQQITDRVRVLIAGQACLLILNKVADYYPGFKTIMVYPETYKAAVTRHDGVLQSRSVDLRAGESWQRGPVVLAWDHVLAGAKDGRDGHNVVMHEFAHKLDEENSTTNGSPVLPSRERYTAWSAVLTKEFELQQKKRLAGDTDVIDNYGATSPAEFFAVVTEVFFEKPDQLKQMHPLLYQQFELFYQLDPAAW